MSDENRVLGNVTARPPISLSFYDTKPYDREYFSPIAGECGVVPRYHEFRLTVDTASSAAGAHAVCVFVNDRLDKGCLTRLSELGVKLVALRCAGFNNVDRIAAGQLGMTVVRVPAYSPHAVAEHSIALLLALNRKIHRAYNRVREQNFSLSGLVGFDLYGKTVGIVGTGKIGRAAAQIFRGFGCRVVAHDPLPALDWADVNGISYAGLGALLSESDVVSLHLPLTQDTHHLLNASTLSRMKPGAFLVNTSRGKLVESSAVIDALKSGHLGGVALDVYEEEEGIFFEDHSGAVLQDDELARLIGFPNVLITAHQAFLTSEALSEIARVTSDSVMRFRDGLPPVPERLVKAE